MPDIWNDIASAAIFATVAVLIAATAYARFRETTLMGTGLWAVMACLVPAAILARMGMISLTQSSQAALHYVAAVGLLLPTISLLGAKRPQNAAWHLIVASLWVVLVLPAAEAYFIRQGSTVQIHDARGWFLWILILTGWANHVATRYGLSATLFAAGQICMLLPHLPLCPSADGPQTLGAASLFLLAMLFAVLMLRRAPRNGGWQQVWIEFRNAYGAVWALRVAERINATAAASHWPVRLTWNGFEWHSENVSPEDRAALTRTFRSLLMRFVSENWLEKYVHGEAAS